MHFTVTIKSSFLEKKI